MWCVLRELLLPATQAPPPSLHRRTLHHAQADSLCARRPPHLHRHPNLTAYRLGVNLTRRVSGEVRPPLITPTPRAVLNTYHEREVRPEQAASCQHAGARC